MTETDQSQEAQITSKMHELAGSICVVTFRQEVDRRGIIERVESVTILKGFPESFEKSQFRVHLTSGDIVIVPGSAISEIESTTVDGSRPMKKKPGVRGGKARTKKIVDEKRRSIATKTPRAKRHKTKKKRKL
jgi:hypothetical protein